MNINLLRKRVLITAIVMMLMVPTGVFAGNEKKHETRAGEVVFLLDASSSMNTQDENRMAIDSIRQAANSLPSSYRTGLVVYNTEVQAVSALNPDAGQIENHLGSVVYTGYTNAGEGLNQAVGLFSEAEDTDRCIIMISDGEIDMPDKQRKDDSRALYIQSASLAKEKAVEIFIIAVGSEINDPGMHIFDGAEQTGGAVYWEGQSGSLTRIIDRIVTERMGFPRQETGVTDSGGGNVHIEIPKGIEQLKLMVTSETLLRDIRADYSAEDGQTITGQRFTVVDVKRPVSQTLDLYFETEDLSGVRAHLLTEFTVEPQVKVVYRSVELGRSEEQIKKNVPPEYEHWADISISLADTGGKKENLWQEQYEGFEFPYTLNGESLKGTVKDGMICTTIPADGLDEIEVSVSTEGMEGLYYISQPVVTEIEKYPDPVFEPVTDYRPLWVIIGLLAIALIVLVTMWIKKKNTTVIYVAQPPAAKEPSKKMETKSCTYTGKINMYVIRTGDGRDVPPQTYRLFGRKAGSMTLEQILTSCKIKLGKIGAGDINFYPGPDRSVIIMDQSEGCTVLRGTEILKKGMGYPVFYNEKITITFDDEETEMEIHYKDLKPSEREV